MRIMYDKETGRSRGFGFVYFSKGDDAASAKDAMDGKVRKELILACTFGCMIRYVNCYIIYLTKMFFFQAYLGRPLRISYALEKVRGGPVVVPRLANSGIANARKN